MSDATVIEFKDVTFSFHGSENRILDIASFHVDKAKRVFIKGPSGCGKSTLLSLIGGVNVPDNGRVSVLNTSLGDLPSTKRDHFRANHIGFIFQMFNLIPYLSLLENVTLPCRFSKKRHAKALEKEQSLENEAVRLLNQLGIHDQSLMQRKVTELSMGQQQRVATARALIGAPEIIIADEPTSALDADSREAFLKLLFSECEAADATLIFVSHDSGLQTLFDQSIALAEINNVSDNRDDLS